MRWSGASIASAISTGSTGFSLRMFPTVVWFPAANRRRPMSLRSSVCPWKGRRLELLDHNAYEVRELVHRFKNLDQGVRPCSSTRFIQEAVIAAVTWNTRAVYSSFQPRVAFTAKMAIYSVGG